VEAAQGSRTCRKVMCFRVVMSSLRAASSDIKQLAAGPPFPLMILVNQERMSIRVSFQHTPESVGGSP
jgi:hypothetical protein